MSIHVNGHDISSQSLLKMVRDHVDAEPIRDTRFKLVLDETPRGGFFFGFFVLLTLVMSKFIGVLAFLILPTGYAVLLFLIIIVFEIFFQHKPSIGRGITVARPLTKMQYNIFNQISKFVNYEPPWWHMNAHSTTIVPLMVVKPETKPIIKQEVLGSDGGVITLEWYIPPKFDKLSGVILLIPGLNGTSTGGYSIDLMNRLGDEKGYCVVVLGGRGVGKSEVQSIESSFHLARIDDIIKALDMIELISGKTSVKFPFFIIGYSAGGIRAVNCASVYGSQLVNRVTGVISFGGAVKNDKSSNMRISKYVYQPMVMHSYISSFFNKLKVVLKVPPPPLTESSPEARFHAHISELFQRRYYSTFADFDMHVTSYVHKMTPEEYYAKSMPAVVCPKTYKPSNNWQNISVPTLIVHSADDPVLHVEDAIVYEMAHMNSFVTLLVTDKGGHIGWPSETAGYEWIANVAYSYISSVVN